MLQWHAKLNILCTGIFMKTEDCVWSWPYIWGYCTQVNTVHRDS